MINILEQERLLAFVFISLHIVNNWKYDIQTYPIIMKEDQCEGITYLPTKFQLDRCIYNRDLLADMQKHELTDA